MSDYHELTLAGWVARKAGQEPDAPARLTRRKARTYGQLWDKAGRLAAGLLKLGIGRSDRIALVLGDEVEHADTIVACSLLGAVFVSLKYDNSLARALAVCGCKGIIAADYALAPIAEARNGVESLRWVIGISTTKGRSTAAQLQARGVRPYAEIAATDPPTRAFAGSLPDDPMQLVFRADKPMMVITHRHYFRTIDRSDTGRAFANQPSF